MTDLDPTPPASQPQAPWLDCPTCPKCEAAVLTSDSEKLAFAGFDDPGVDGGWLLCPGCGEVSDVDQETHARARRADDWWNRPTRDQDWAEVLRVREVDRVAAEHAARQLRLFEGEQ